MAKNDPPSSTVAYITLITRVFWSFLGRVIIFIKNMTMLHFSWKFHFHEKWAGRWFSSHDEGPASTARFTGGQVIRESHRNKRQKKCIDKNKFCYLSRDAALFASPLTLPPQTPPLTPPLTPPWPPQNGPGITSTPKIVKKWGFLGIVMGFS